MAIYNHSQIEGASYNTPKYLMVLYDNVCYCILVQRTFIAKKVRLTYFLPENSQRKEDQAKINYSVTLHNPE